MIRTLDEIIKKREETIESIDILNKKQYELRSITIEMMGKNESKTDKYKELVVDLGAVRFRLNTLYGVKKALDYLVNYDSYLDTDASYVVKYESGAYKKS